MIDENCCRRAAAPSRSVLNVDDLALAAGGWLADVVSAANGNATLLKDGTPSS